MWWKCALALIQISVVFVPIYKAKTCKIKDELPKNCDYIIVGAGASGATIASRLSENPNINVCLFEAGIKNTEGQFANSLTVPELISSINPGDYAWNTSTVPQKGLNNMTLNYGMGKVLGGSTTHNGFNFFRGFKADFDFWADNGALGWEFDSVLPFFKRSENITAEELRKSPLHSTCGPLKLSEEELGLNSPYAKLWENTAKEINLPIGECNRETPFGLCSSHKTHANGKRVSTATAFLHPNIRRRNLFIVTEALVGRILILHKEKRAYGIRYLKHGRLRTVRATKEIIVSGGTIESPNLLQISGIGPKPLLQRLKIRPKAILPVGLIIMDHPIQTLGIVSTIPVPNIEDLRDPKTLGEYLFQGKGLYGSTGAPLNLFLDIVKQKHNWPEIQVLLAVGSALIASVRTIPDTLNNNRQASILAMFLSHPKSRGTVTARSADPEDAPLIDPGYYTHPDDIPTMIKGIRMIQKILKTSQSMRKASARLDLNFPAENCITEANSDNTDQSWACVLRQQITIGQHPVRGCPIGSEDDRWAVVDPKLRVYGIKDLRVADASVMPEISSGNTMGPAIMMGERAADIILKDYVTQKY